jgi:hypothetical protein
VKNTGLSENELYELLNAKPKFVGEPNIVNLIKEILPARANNQSSFYQYGINLVIPGESDGRKTSEFESNLTVYKFNNPAVKKTYTHSLRFSFVPYSTDFEGFREVDNDLVHRFAGQGEHRVLVYPDPFNYDGNLSEDWNPGIEERQIKRAGQVSKFKINTGYLPLLKKEGCKNLLEGLSKFEAVAKKAGRPERFLTPMMKDWLTISIMKHMKNTLKSALILGGALVVGQVLSNVAQAQALDGWHVGQRTKHAIKNGITDISDYAIDALNPLPDITGTTSRIAKSFVNGKINALEKSFGWLVSQKQSVART